MSTHSQEKIVSRRKSSLHAVATKRLVSVNVAEPRRKLSTLEFYLAEFENYVMVHVTHLAKVERLDSEDYVEKVVEQLREQSTQSGAGADVVTSESVFCFFASKFIDSVVAQVQAEYGDALMADAKANSMAQIEANIAAQQVPGGMLANGASADRYRTQMVPVRYLHHLRLGLWAIVDPATNTSLATHSDDSLGPEPKTAQLDHALRSICNYLMTDHLPGDCVATQQVLAANTTKLVQVA